MKTVPVKKLLFPLIILALANWSTDQTTVEVSGLKKNRVNFYGMLHTRNGEIYNVDNISIGRLYKQILVYEKPDSTQITLEADPKSGIITKLDLSEIQEIRVPHPSTIWHFKRADGSRKTDYIEIEVTQKGQVSRYLIDTHRKLMCDQISPSGPIEKEVPFHALDRIIITGFKQREESKQNKEGTVKVEEKKKSCGCSHTQVGQARPDAPCCPECPGDKDCQSSCDSQKVAQCTDCHCGPECKCEAPCRCSQDTNGCS